MDIERLFRRAWEIVWNYKWLILLGVLVVIGTSGFGNPGGNRGAQFDQDGDDSEPRETDGMPDPGELNPQEFFEGMDENVRTFAAIAIPLIIAICGLVALCLVALWAIGRIASGALIAGVDQIEGLEPQPGQAWSAGWNRGWRLIGIDLIVTLPFLTAVLVDLALIIPAVNIANDLDDTSQIFAGGGLLFTAGTIFCLGWAVTATLRIISGLAGALHDRRYRRL
jgi:hypothetical protein